MVITPHALVGASLATATQSLPLAFILGFFSHFVIDAIPHLDPGTFFENKNKKWPLWVYIYSFTEIIIFPIVFYILFHHRPDFTVLCVGALGGITVDLIDSNPFIRFLREKPGFAQLHWLHDKFHFFIKPKYWFWGLLTELIVIGGTLWYLLKF
ncbi:MAG: hypothetical protein WCP93_03815 [Candidatus Berkelbacteria bacterium]